MRILVTGGAGFIGSQLIEDLCMDNHNVTVIDSLDSTLYSADIKKAKIKKLASKFDFEFHSMDINDNLEFLLKSDLEYVINLAALPGQVLSWSHLPDYTKSNFLGVGNILKTLIAAEKIPFLQISTSSVYGKIASGNENQLLEPFSPYGVTKRAAEDLIQSYKSNYDLTYTIFRLFSVFGPGQRPDMAVHKFLKLIDAGQEVQIYGDGNQSRSMTDVAQVSKSILNLIGLINPIEKSSVYNISGGSSITVLDLISICERIVGKTAKVNFITRPAGDQLETRGNTSKAEKELGFDPRLEIEDVVARQFESIKTYGL
jgi:UDP-glucuronate 4-epimerase